MDENNQESQDFGTYDDYNISPDEELTPEQDLEEEQTEEQFEEEQQTDYEQASRIEDKVNGIKDRLMNKNSNDSNPIKGKLSTYAKESGKKTAQAAGKAAKATGKAFVHLVKLLFTPPILWFTIIALAIVLVFGIIFLAVAGGGGAPYANIDPTNGQFATSMGITGDKFYGARAIYLNPEQSQLDLKDYYYAFSEDFLESVDAMEHVDLNVGVNVEDITPELSKLIAKAVSASTEDLTLEQYLTSIDHFGYTNIELDNIKISFIDYVLDNQSTLLTIADDYSTLETDLYSIFDTKYSGYNITAPLYYVKDIILEENEEAMIPSEEARNFIAMIYLPRTAVELETASYMFYFPEIEENPDAYIEGYANSIEIEFITVANGEQNSIFSNTADSTWWQDGSAELTADIEDINLQLSPFTSIDIVSPLNNVNIYSLILDENKELILDAQKGTVSFEILNKYFSNTLIEDSETGETYYNISYLSNDLSYYYLKFTADGIFQFCEFETKFE